MGETLSHTAKAQAVLPSRGRSVGLRRSGPSCVELSDRLLAMRMDGCQLPHLGELQKGLPAPGQSG